MALSEKSGMNLYVAFGNTPANLSTDFRSFEETETKDTVEATAGADASKTYIALTKDGTASFSGLYITAGAGTTVWAALAPGTEGSLIWAEEGTAAIANYHWVNAICTERSKSIPYDGVIEINASFQFNGAVSDGTYG